MAFQAVYESATGRLVSTGTVIAPDSVLTEKGLLKKLVAAQHLSPDGMRLLNGKRWNEMTQDFEDDPDFIPPDRRIDRKQFLDRFTSAEREDIYEAARTSGPAVRKRLDAFLQYVRDSDDVWLDDPYIQGSVSRMETAGLIAAGRAAEILI